MSIKRHPSSRFGKVWEFRTKRFTVSLHLERDHRYQYDGDDEDGEMQRMLDSGEYVAFDSVVTVELDGEEIATNYLGGSVYGADEVAQFYTAHRDPDPLHRNCTIMRADWSKRVAGVANPDSLISICHYFPSMVLEAISDARAHVASMTVPPRLRELAHA